MRGPRLAVVIVALAAMLLSGCSDEQFRELMLTLAFGLVVLVVGSIVLSLINLVVLGGGVAMLAINLFGAPTHRARTYGFVFGGLNVATGVSGLVATLSAMFVFHEDLRVAFTPEGPSGTVHPGPDLFVGGIISVVLALGTLALGVACIVAAARAKPVDRVP